MGLSTVSDGKRIVYSKGQLATDSSKFSAPYFATIVMYPDTKTLDIKLTCMIENVYELDGSFDYFTFEPLKENIRINKLYLLDETQNSFSSVIPFGNQTGLTSSLLMGRSGLLFFANRPDVTTFCIGRAYDDSLNAGGWPMNRENLILVGRGYIIDIKGLKYE